MRGSTMTGRRQLGHQMRRPVASILSVRTDCIGQTVRFARRLRFKLRFGRFQRAIRQLGLCRCTGFAVGQLGNPPVGIEFDGIQREKIITCSSFDNEASRRTPPRLSAYVMQ